MQRDDDIGLASPAAAARYVGVLGACCSADAVRLTAEAGEPASDLRLLYYQDRTSWLSMVEPALHADEFGFDAREAQGPDDAWMRRMVLDEALKRHLPRLQRDGAFTDLLLIDAVCAFVFPHLIHPDSGRTFLESDEWRQLVRPSLSMQRRWLWQLPTERFIDAGRQVLLAIHARRPDLRIVFHMARPCFNDGAHFAVPEVQSHADFFAALNERIAEDFCRSIPRFSAVQPTDPRADPDHPGGVHPFGYDAAYLRRLRWEIVRLAY